MSVSVTLAELADVAFRTPNSGSVNAGALHLLLRGLLEHLRLQDASTQVSEDERGLLEPGAGAGGRPRAPLLQAEGQPGCPGGSPGTAELPTPRRDGGRPGTDTWQTAQLTERMEVIEEGMTKVRSHPRRGARLQRGASRAGLLARSYAFIMLPYTVSCPTQGCVRVVPCQCRDLSVGISAALRPESLAKCRDMLLAQLPPATLGGSH